jgi:protocatechuate 3,4-dioxygenase beta subunit
MAQHGQPDLYDLGLQADVAMWNRTAHERRRVLKMGALGVGVLLAGARANAALAAGESAARAAACVGEIPQETAGPYPADGSQASNANLDALTIAGIVRKDIRTSAGTGHTAPGIPMTIELTLVDSAGACAPLAGYAVYVWHCNRDGQYSLYSSGVTGEDYLRGVQAADANGKVTFTSIFPACYSGRWPHVHLEVYPSLAKATAASNAIHTSQIALPKAACDAVYATSGYSQSVTNLSRITLASDNVFGDGYSLQLATVTGGVIGGYATALTVGIDPAGKNTGSGTAPGTDGAPTGAPPPGAAGGGPAQVPAQMPNTGGGGMSGGTGAWTLAARFSPWRPSWPRSCVGYGPNSRRSRGPARAGRAARAGRTGR